MREIEIYTDGACCPNPGTGGWGYVVFEDKREPVEVFGGELKTTNNQMELTAAVMALKALETRTQVTLYTDSQYVRKGITNWIKGWKRNGWKTASGKPVKNQDLWQLLDEASSKHVITWKWVKGHNGNAGNELADQLASKGRESVLKAKQSKNPAPITMNTNEKYIKMLEETIQDAYQMLIDGDEYGAEKELNETIEIIKED